MEDIELDVCHTCITCANAINSVGKPYTDKSAVALCAKIINRVNGLPESCDILRTDGVGRGRCGPTGHWWIARAD